MRGAARALLATGLLVTSVGLGSVPVAQAEDHPAGWPATESAVDPVSSDRLEQLACQDVLVVGVRGSGEEAPWGATVGGVADSLTQRLSGDVRSVYLDYPAVDPHTLGAHELEAHVLESVAPSTDYFESVDAGREELRRVLQHSAERCPDQAVVLAGFSQGAQVITRALASGADSSTLAGALLLGNPAHHPGQNTREIAGLLDTPSIGLAATLTYLRSQARPEGDTSRRAAVRNLIEEVFALHGGSVPNSRIARVLAEDQDVIPPELYSRVLSICSEGDLVCDAAPGMSRMLTSSTTLEEEFHRARPVHGGYTEDVVAPGVAELLVLASTWSPDGGPARVPDTPSPSTSPGRDPSASGENGADASPGEVPPGLPTGPASVEPLPSESLADESGDSQEEPRGGDGDDEGDPAGDPAGDDDEDAPDDGDAGSQPEPTGDASEGSDDGSTSSEGTQDGGGPGGDGGADSDGEETAASDQGVGASGHPVWLVPVLGTAVAVLAATSAGLAWQLGGRRR